MAAPFSVLSRPTLRPVLVRSAMSGFLLLGGLVALLGALLPVWMYHLHFDLGIAGNYFLVFNLGIFAAAMVSRAILLKLGLRLLLVLSCSLNGLSFLVLAILFSPVAIIVPLIALGFAAGTLTTGLSWLMTETISARRAASGLSLAGLCFGLGAVGLTWLIQASVHLLAPPGLMSLIAVVPLALAVLYFRQRSLGEPAFRTAPLRLSWRETGSPLAVLLSLALFFQSSSEWAAGGWLATYFVRRLGVSLDTALLGLAVYWVILTLAKLLSPRLSWAATPFRLLASCAGAALLGCLFLFSTSGLGGAILGVLLLGGGLGALYPLTVTMIGEKFPYYHPGFFNGLFSLSLIGGMFAPWLIGHMAQAGGIQWAVVVPALGVIMVLLLQCGILLEARLGSGFPAPPPPVGPGLPERSGPPPRSR